MKEYCTTDLSVFRVLGVLEMNRGLSMGVHEDNLVEKSGLSEERVLMHLAGLIGAAVVASQVLQIGSGGTCGHFYKLCGEGLIRITSVNAPS